MAKKIYFYDNGIRNALLSNFQKIESRQDTGALFEIFLVADSVKKNHYTKNYANIYFWRTKEQQEIDYLEEKDGRIEAFEFKWNVHKKVKFAKTFTDAYPTATTKLITPENFTTFLM